jgi:hypothetical protein
MTVTRDIAATRQRVWDVLANGWTCSGLGKPAIGRPGKGQDFPCQVTGSRKSVSLAVSQKDVAGIDLAPRTPGGCDPAVTRSSPSDQCQGFPGIGFRRTPNLCSTVEQR